MWPEDAYLMKAKWVANKKKKKNKVFYFLRYNSYHCLILLAQELAQNVQSSKKDISILHAGYGSWYILEESVKSCLSLVKNTWFCFENRAFQFTCCFLNFCKQIFELFLDYIFAKLGVLNFLSGNIKISCPLIWSSEGHLILHFIYKPCFCAYKHDLKFSAQPKDPSKKKNYISWYLVRFGKSI